MKIDNFFKSKIKNRSLDLENGRKNFVANDRVHTIGFAVAMYIGGEKMFPKDTSEIIGKSKSDNVWSMLCLYYWMCGYNKEPFNLDLRSETIESTALKLIELLVAEAMYNDPSQETIEQVFKVLWNNVDIQVLSTAYAKAIWKHKSSLQNLEEYLMLNPAQGLAIKPFD